MNVGKLGLFLTVKKYADLFAQHGGGVTRLNDLHQSEPLAERRREPSRFGDDSSNAKPRLLDEFADDSALQIDNVALDIIRVWRAGREVDLSCGRGVIAHHAEQ